MPNYEYLCDGCGHNYEIVESIKISPKRVCPACNAELLHRVIHLVDGICKGEPKTLGQQAERNDKKFGRYGLEEKRAEQQKLIHSNKKEVPDPWWRKGKPLDLSLAKYAPKTIVKNGEVTSEPLTEKATKYIMEGYKT